MLLVIFLRQWEQNGSYLKNLNVFSMDDTNMINKTM